MHEIETFNDLEFCFEQSSCLSLAKPGFKWIKPGEPLIMGIPLDLSSTFRPGTRFAPGAIRNASVNLEPRSMRLNTSIEGSVFSDIGDLLINSINLDLELEKIASIARVVNEDGFFPVYLGGEHSITPVVLPEIQDLGVLVLDGHFDLRDSYQEHRRSHATACRRIYEQVGSENLFIIGARGQCNEEKEFIEKHGVKHVLAKDILREHRADQYKIVKEFILSHDKVYLSIDMDVFDPGYAPAVGCPEPEGLSPTIMLDIISLIQGAQLAGCDLVELCPGHDNGQTAMLAARLVFEILNLKVGK
ncbi:MAG: agmatinase [Candidatus Hodarchaeota archaeon]